MKKATYTIMLLFLATILFSSCKKYEEGPSFSLLSKKSRLKGVWELKSIDENSTLFQLSYEGTLSTSCGTEVTYSEGTSYSKYELEFEKDGDVELTQIYTYQQLDWGLSSANCEATYYTSTESTDFVKGDWEWEDGKEDIELTIGNYRIEYEILKLTKTELKLETLTGEVWEFEKD
jgi:hypothetical protein